MIALPHFNALSQNCKQKEEVSDLQRLSCERNLTKRLYQKVRDSSLEDKSSSLGDVTLYA